MFPFLTKWLHRLNSPSPYSSLKVIDNRSGKKYTIPIERNSVKALDFLAIQPDRVSSKAEYIDGGLKVLDTGYNNTACVESAITLIDGKKGTIHFRGEICLHLRVAGLPVIL
jgi:hypothetical protein